MPHTIFVDDTVVIRRVLNIPNACPKCKRIYKLGETILKSQTLRPREEKLLLSTVTDEGTTRKVVSVSNVAQFSSNPRLILDVKCNSCGHILAATISRMYELEGMDRVMAFKLRGLLYDSNVRDPMARKKCYDETEGYHGDCMACNIEADIGTEEVPHPIDVRMHTCKKTA